MSGSGWWIGTAKITTHKALSAIRKGRTPGSARVLRGGSMSSDPYRLRTTDRSGLPPSATYLIVGFRCATSDLPATAVQSASWGQIKRITEEGAAR